MNYLYLSLFAWEKWKDNQFMDVFLNESHISSLRGYENLTHLLNKLSNNLKFLVIRCRFKLRFQNAVVNLKIMTSSNGKLVLASHLIYRLVRKELYLKNLSYINNKSI